MHHQRIPATSFHDRNAITYEKLYRTTIASVREPANLIKAVKSFNGFLECAHRYIRLDALALHPRSLECPS